MQCKQRPHNFTKVIDSHSGWLETGSERDETSVTVLSLVEICITRPQTRISNPQFPSKRLRGIGDCQAETKVRIN